jgi:DNA-binding MarR family transcriptional regulator
VTHELQTEFPDASESPGLALWRVTHSWQRAIRDALEPFELTHMQFVLLASLTWMDRSSPVTQRELADHVGIDIMMTSQVLRALEGKGLIERARHPSDGRAFALEPTASGTALANRANAAVERADRAYFAPLGASVGGFTRQLIALDRPHARPHEAGR